MSQNIKSKYIVKYALSYMNEKTKLYLIKYSKRLQNITNISLINYKVFSGKYIIYDNNNNKKGKEYKYYGDKLIYEGEFLNLKKHGKGKEYYYNGNIEYEGEYINGKRHGKGKEYNDKGNLLYDGEYLNGKKHGKGKEYNNTGKLIFEGKYMKGKRANGGIYDCFNKKHNIKDINGFIKEYYHKNILVNKRK